MLKQCRKGGTASLDHQLSEANTAASKGLESKGNNKSTEDKKPISRVRKKVFGRILCTRISKTDTDVSRGMQSKASVVTKAQSTLQLRTLQSETCRVGFNSSLVNEDSNEDSKTVESNMPVTSRRKGISIAKRHVRGLLTGNRNTVKIFNRFPSLAKQWMSHRMGSYRRLVWRSRVRDWLVSFHRLDPRYQILTFFDDVARDGARRIEDADCKIKEGFCTSPILKVWTIAAAFSVWRPTSNDAIRKMMTGEVSGKGLDIKGKSAKKGKLSGLVPFVQIHTEIHKSKVRWPPKDAMVRIFFKSEDARDRAAIELTSVSEEMVTTFSDARDKLAESRTKETDLEHLNFDVEDGIVCRLNDYSPSHFGVIVAERIFFQTYISRQDISRCSEYKTGRPSEPAFQDMNFTCVRNYKGSGPRAVVLQTTETADDALKPQSLVVAYEGNGRVAPVASDFDCFLVGTRNVEFKSSLSDDQVKVLKWQLTQIEMVLDSTNTSESWTSRWLEVLKQSKAKGFCPTMPEYGFGDPKSYAIMEDVVGRLGDSGAVRHGAESFNYFFPQELDDKFLVISDHFEGNVPWKYVDVEELRDILCNRIDRGFTFPLNPKWILADPGWKKVYDKMMSSDDEDIQLSMDVWYPEDSGIRKRIEDIHARFPDGFQRLNVERGNCDEKAESAAKIDLAEMQLEYCIENP